MSLPQGRIHIVGAGGAGMSALSKVLVARGFELSASDLRGGAVLDSLADLGVSVTTGHTPEAVTGASLLVASSAVPDYDEELLAAATAGIPVWRRPQLVSALSENTETIGATGTHGKTTTTAMLITALRQIGEDPSFVVGGEMIGLGTNGHNGADDLLVIEADEAFRTFESLHLNGLVVTNVEAEHLGHFGTEADLVDSFVSVVDGVAGPVVVCLDDAGSASVAARTGAITYGTDKDSDWLVSDVASGADKVTFQLSGRDQTCRVEIPQPGRHVALNAAGALALAAELGRDITEMAIGLGSYRGVGRRWESRGTIAGVTLVDDYAHHPTEVAAVLDAVVGTIDGRIWAVFQPHLFSRTERFSDEFGIALAAADVAVVTDVFGAREEPVPGVTGELVADAVARAGGEVHYVPHRFDLASFVAPRVDAGDLVVSLGAGDITLLHNELAPLLGSEYG